MARPSAPTIGTATDTGSGAISVTFTASNLGPSATSFTLTSSSGVTSSGASSPLTLQEAEAGTYTYTVRPTNANGNGPSSATSTSVVVESVFAPVGAYDSLAAVTLSSTASTVTFSDIPSGYKHLEIRGIARGTRNGEYDRVDYRFNGDTGSNYSRHLILSDWGVNTPSSYTYTNQNILAAAYIAGATSVSNTFGGFVLSIMDYASTTKYKTARTIGGATNNGSGSYVSVTSGVYRSLDPINSITIGPIEEGSSLAAYSSIALYGVK